MKRKISLPLALIVGALILSFTTIVSAETCFDKLGRGLVNTASGWIEIANQAVLTSEEHNAFVGSTYGTAKGVGIGTYRTGVGIYDTATFIIPPYDAAYIEPVFIFGK